MSKRLVLMSVIEHIENISIIHICIKFQEMNYSIKCHTFSTKFRKHTRTIARMLTQGCQTVKIEEHRWEF